MEKRGGRLRAHQDQLVGDDIAGEVYVFDIQGGVIYRISGGSLAPS
jgi:hypothetical protein